SGDGERALDILDASWRLNQTIAKRLELISGLIALVVDRYEHRTLRLLRRVPPSWDTRIRDFRFLDANALELRGEAVMGLAAGRHPERGEIAVGSALRPFLGPYISLGLAEHVDRMDRLAIETASLTARDLEGTRIKDIWEDRHPRWNIVGKIAWPNLADSSRK